MSETIEQSAPSEEAVDEKLAGIGGWLILPAIGFVLGPVVGVVALVISLGLYPDVASAGFGEVFALELAVLAGLLGFTIYAAVLFFGKKRNAPRTIIALFVVSIVSSGILLAVEVAAGAEDFALESGKQLVRDIIGAAIWIPYFNVSKRVKATFVK